MQQSPRHLAWLLIVTLSACGGGGGGQPSIDNDPPVIGGIDHVAALEAVLDDLNVDDYAIVIGDADGILLQREFGSFTVADSEPVASASKWLATMIILDLVEQGVMALDDRPQDYLAWWTSDPGDARSEVTLEQLLSFTAGFDVSPDDDSCVNDGGITLDDCARAFYDAGLAYAPGSTFHYGPAHLQVAGRMAEVAGGQSFANLALLQQAIRFNLSDTVFLLPVGANPRVGGGAVSSARDYAVLLEAILDGTYLSGVVETMRQDRTGPPVVIGERPGAVDSNGVDFRYALGNWRECDQPNWDASCDANVISSSPGAFGWHPWIDFNNGYFGIIAMREVSVAGGSPTAASVGFALQIRPLIIAALEDLRAQR